MKKSLKKSEIIENLHRVLGVKFCTPLLFSIVQIDDNFVVYHLLLMCRDETQEYLQIVSVSLHFGWIEYVVDSAFEKDEMDAAKKCYYRAVGRFFDDNCLS